MWGWDVGICELNVGNIACGQTKEDCGTLGFRLQLHPKDTEEPLKIVE